MIHHDSMKVRSKEDLIICLLHVVPLDYRRCDKVFEVSSYILERSIKTPSNSVGASVLGFDGERYGTEGLALEYGAKD